MEFLGYRKVWISEKEFKSQQVYSEGDRFIYSNLMNANKTHYLEWLKENTLLETVNYIPPEPYVDPRTNEEKRNDDYKSIIDPITQKILSYQLESELEVDPVRKAVIEKDIIKPLKDEWISKRKSIRSKYPGGLWKPTV